MRSIKALFVHAAIALATLTAVLVPLAFALAPASASVGVSSIYSQGECVAAETAAFGAPVTFAKCNPSDPAQHWAFNPSGTFHLTGTNKFIVSSEAGSVLGTSAQATQFVYVNHELAGEGEWLTQTAANPEPFLTEVGTPFIVFTAVK